MEVIPDKIVLSIHVSEFEKSKETIEDREVKMREVLEGIGINTKESLSVLDFNSGYKYGRSIKSSKEYELTLNEPSIVPAVYLKLEEINISNISVVEITHSKLKEYEQKVKLEAVKSAKVKSDGMLAQLDQKVGKTLFIQEKGKYLPSEYFQEYSARDYRTRMNATGAISRGSSGPEYDYPIPELSFRKIELAYNVLIRFEIL
jgi:uncharacterized protein YggE